VIDAVKTFLKRCRKVGAQLNEVADDVDIETFSVDTISETAGVFLGEHFDYIRKTVAVSAKTHEKLSLCRARLAEHIDSHNAVSVRQFASHIALLFYTSPTLGISLANYYNALRYYRDLSAELACDVHLWNAPQIPTMPPTVAREFLAWTDLVLRNTQ
jgi:hypothetical protein